MSTVPRRRRPSAQHRAVLEALRGDDRFRDARDLYAQLSAQGSRIGLVTVYRALRALTGQGAVETQLGEDGTTRYRAALGEHHHYLVCRHCGKAVAFQLLAVEQQARDLARRHGFTDLTHRIDLHGTCADCAAGRPAQPESATS